jgi:UMF1 family MFS transporter
MMGKFAVILGPLIVGAVAVITRDSRLSILAVAVLFLAGGGILAAIRLPDSAGGRAK